MKELTINTQAIFNANGHHTGGNRNKPVIDLDTGVTYASGLDAAEALGSTSGNVSMCCLGKTRTVKGHHLAYVAHARQNVDVLAERIRAMNAKQTELERKAKLYDTAQANPIETEALKVELAKANEKLSALDAYKAQRQKVKELKAEYLRELEVLEAMAEAL